MLRASSIICGNTASAASVRPIVRPDRGAAAQSSGDLHVLNICGPKAPLLILLVGLVRARRCGLTLSRQCLHRCPDMTAGQRPSFGSILNGIARTPYLGRLPNARRHQMVALRK